jgi:LCP family protein required for cell wall assembly
MNTTPLPKKIPLAQILVTIAALALAGAAFFLTRGIITSWCLSPLPGTALTDCGNAPSLNIETPAEGTPAATADPLAALPTAAAPIPEAALPPTWDGASRVSVLLLGLDTADGSGDRAGPARSDTMILLTIDPQTKTAGMLSIPRDLWVNIPGFGYGRINTAYMQGDAYKVPGGGPALAMQTVEQVIGVPVQYYAQIEFWAFTKLIDDLGKIEVNVTKKISIDPVGPGADDIILPVGVHSLGGVEALAYVRQRHTEGGDVDRANRQQQVILAVRDKILDPTNFTTMLANAPEMYSHIQEGVHTNLTFDDMMRLGMLVKDIPLESIKRGVIDETMFTFQTVSVNGQTQQVLKPISYKIRELRDSIFSAGITSPMATGADALDIARQEGASIVVYNATGTSGLAETTAQYLQSLGLNVTGFESAGQIFNATVVVDHRGKPYTLRYFKELFGLNGGSQIQSKFDPASGAEIELYLGNDWALNNPMP